MILMTRFLPKSSKLVKVNSQEKNGLSIKYDTVKLLTLLQITGMNPKQALGKFSAVSCSV
jgi:hypothetical protein